MNGDTNRYHLRYRSVSRDISMRIARHTAQCLPTCAPASRDISPHMAVDIEDCVARYQPVSRAIPVGITRHTRAYSAPYRAICRAIYIGIVGHVAGRHAPCHRHALTSAMASHAGLKEGKRRLLHLPVSRYRGLTCGPRSSATRISTMDGRARCPRFPPDSRPPSA